MAAAIRVDLLGGVKISGAERAGDGGSSRAILLLAYLVSHDRRPQPRAHLAQLLWPDSETAQARTNLRRELHHLRNLLAGSDCLRVDPQTLRWRQGPGCVVDVQEFRAASESAIAAADAGDPAGVEADGTRALALYRGPFLPGLHDDWVCEVREDLGRACVELCDRVGDYWLGCGDFTAAAVFARRRTLLEPLEEAGYRMLMRAQRGAGDRAAAMRTYHQCATILERELGVRPSPETQAELDAALADSGYGSAGAETGTADHVMTPAPLAFVGREAELGRLLASWRTAQSHCQFAVVVGDAGVGKTRLVEELAKAVRGDEALVVATRCFAATDAVPLAPVADWLRNPYLKMATMRLDPVWRAEIARLVPEEQSGTGLGGGRAKVDAWQRVQFFEGLARAFLSVDRPLLLVIDDLQWCDKATVSWLSFLMSFTGAAALLVVATARRDELARSDIAEQVQAMSATGGAEHLSLGDLSAEESALLAAGIRGHPLSEDELALVMSATRGNPLYLAEVLRKTSARPGPLTATDLDGVLDSRLSRLSAQAQQVAQLASAVGRDFTLNLLIEASDLSEAAVVRQVDELWRHRLLEEHGRGYDFAHELLRAAAYRRI
ncbi:MAG: AAA family ATPase, partial [Micrococcales bacterium]|nr:AAA family ATPase [Micrococcales bacterium]